MTVLIYIFGSIVFSIVLISMFWPQLWSKLLTKFNLQDNSLVKFIKDGIFQDNSDNSALPTDSESPGTTDQPENTTHYLPVKARVYDNTTIPQTIYTAELSHEIQNQIITDYPVMRLGRQWNMMGEWLYSVCKTATGYIPVEKFLTEERKNPPSKLHNHLVRNEIEITHDMKKEKTFMDQYGHFIWPGVAIAFIIFLMIASR